MSIRITIERRMDFETFIDTLIDLNGQATSRGVTNTIKKRNKPRLTGDLMDNVRDDRVSRDEYHVMTDLPYSAAQELGRPDLQSYTYTPYMEPGALSGTTGSKMNTYVDAATNGAIARSKI